MLSVISGYSLVKSLRTVLALSMSQLDFHIQAVIVPLGLACAWAAGILTSESVITSSRTMARGLARRDIVKHPFAKIDFVPEHGSVAASTDRYLLSLNIPVLDDAARCSI